MSDEAPAALVRIEGHADEAGPEAVRGWAWDPARPDLALPVLLLDRTGAAVLTRQATIARGDLAEAGKRGGICGFEAALPSDAVGPFTLVARDPTGAAPDLILAEGVVGPAYVDVRVEARRLAGLNGKVGWLEQADAAGLAGWVHGAELFGPALALTLVEDGRVLAETTADRWRTDLEDLRQGDGRCGFRFDLPAALQDGDAHWLEVRLADGGALMPGPVRVEAPGAAPAAAASPPPRRPQPDTPPAISVVVNFYDMEREAGRTLHSLSRAFQRDVEEIGYEVLCVDNGSNPPLDEAFVEGFGPEFRLVRPTRPHPSPCGPLNEAAVQARGRWLAVMIDGAHILSPGALAEAHAALTQRPGAVVALRQWFVGGDQRWFSSVGYSRALEDILFARIGWPHEPYRLFDISAPMYESPNSWHDGLSESNCLFVPADLWRRIGGFDEAFLEPGAGFANLDLFRRAAQGAEAVVALVGEATFHQYHGGVTTNIGDAEKERRVRGYVREYEDMRGEGFVNVEPEDIRLSGGMRTPMALTARQRPYSPARLGLTAEVRPRTSATQFDELAQQSMQAAYVETGRWKDSRWMGREVGVAPTDLVDIQEALWRARPERIVVAGGAFGLVAFVASILAGIGLADTTLLWVSERAEDAPPGVVRLSCDPLSDAVFADLEAAMGDAERTLAIYHPGPDDRLPVAALTRYARLVSFDSYLIVPGAALGQPWLGYARLWLYRAIVRFTEGGHGFVIDRSLNRHFVTTSPCGFLRRVLNPIPVERYDPALDDLEGL